MKLPILPENYKHVLALIPQGAERPRAGKEIVKLTGLDIRTVRGIIRGLVIKYHIAICGSRDLAGGYYIPANDSERLAGIRALDRQRQDEQKRISALMYANLNEQDKYLKGS